MIYNLGISLMPELVEELKKKGIIKSKMEWDRLLKQGAIHPLEITLRIGKKRFIKISQ